MVEGERRPGMGQRRLVGPPRILIVLGVWALLVGGLQLYAWQEQLNPTELTQ